MKRTLLFFLIAMFIGGQAQGQSTNHIPIAELQRLHLPDVTLESLAPGSSGPQNNNGRAYLEVKGTIGGHIRFELLLPDDWNGNFVMGGGGGFVGTVQNA